jgi:hypothetical protein
MYYITSPVLDFRLYNTIGNSHTVNITNSNFLLYIFHKLGASTATLASNINVLGQFNFELGVLNLNNYNLNCFAITSSGVIGAVRTIVGPGTLNPTSNVTISTITGRSGVGITGTGYTINMTGTGNKTFAGGGGIFGTINNASAQLTITGSNTFDDITSTTKPGIVRVTAGTTQTVNNFTLSGSAAGRITLNSVTAGTQFTLSKPSGTVNTYYLDIKDCNATGGAVWNTDSNTSVNSGNNLGWIFTSLVIVVSAVLGQFFAFF